MKKKLLTILALAVSAMASAHHSGSLLVQGAGQLVNASYQKASIAASLATTVSSATAGGIVGTPNGFLRFSQVISSYQINDISSSAAQSKLGTLTIEGNTATFSAPATYVKTLRSVAGVITTASYPGTLTVVAVDNKSGTTISTNYDSATIQFTSNLLDSAGHSVATMTYIGLVKLGDIIVFASTTP